MLGEPDLAITDQPVHLLRLLRIERTPSTAHFEQQYTQRPEIDMLAVSLFIQQHFRREVLGRAAERVGELVVGEVGLGQAEITQSYVARRIEQDVFGLEITADQYDCYHHGKV